MWNLKTYFKTIINDIVTEESIPVTLIGTGTEIYLDKLVSKEPIRIDGTIYGNIYVDNTLSVGETGTIYGNIKAANIIIAGKVEGDIDCNITVHLLSSSKVYGNVKSQNIIMDIGSIVGGSYDIGHEVKVSNDAEFKFIPITNQLGEI